MLDRARGAVGEPLQMADTPVTPPPRQLDSRKRKRRESSSAAKRRRVISIDALRGFNIFWIIGGDGLIWSLDRMSDGKGPLTTGAGKALGAQFGHVAWEGFTFYDFIFPLFIFITGASIVFSLTRLVEREGKAAAHWRVLRRS